MKSGNGFAVDYLAALNLSQRQGRMIVMAKAKIGDANEWED
ncbi:hypothetical protein [Lysinibacillus pakistanensis]|uniref:Uncharacterized protein n=1 Tax=Lysinibacillus pakistanensis TaxID=759811 RepID=A0AAX3WQL2_9BACI|nr:hypothetical protein [Lysinibacillus pakistanensis]MDM5234489.1 hypothetical protein [Lysinibacillus pakistanensis]WHY45068.1 hypothetical protein QNH22_17355 [Lysinibacillus pakistanensis]WHY50076.1 hypothetical protein QNH24_17320 [Lysinibacillus pakistanensis]